MRRKKRKNLQDKKFGAGVIEVNRQTLKTRTPLSLDLTLSFKTALTTSLNLTLRKSRLQQMLQLRQTFQTKKKKSHRHLNTMVKSVRQAVIRATEKEVCLEVSELRWQAIIQGLPVRGVAVLSDKKVLLQKKPLRLDLARKRKKNIGKETEPLEAITMKMENGLRPMATMMRTDTGLRPEAITMKAVPG